MVSSGSNPGLEPAPGPPHRATWSPRPHTWSLWPGEREDVANSYSAILSEPNARSLAKPAVPCRLVERAFPMFPPNFGSQRRPPASHPGVHLSYLDGTRLYPLTFHPYAGAPGPDSSVALSSGVQCGSGRAFLPPEKMGAEDKSQVGAASPGM